MARFTRPSEERCRGSHPGKLSLTVEKSSKRESSARLLFELFESLFQTGCLSALNSHCTHFICSYIKSLALAVSCLVNLGVQSCKPISPGVAGSKGKGSCFGPEKPQYFSTRHPHTLLPEAYSTSRTHFRHPSSPWILSLSSHIGGFSN